MKDFEYRTDLDEKLEFDPNKAEANDEEVKDIVGQDKKKSKKEKKSNGNKLDKRAEKKAEKQRIKDEELRKKAEQLRLKEAETKRKAEEKAMKKAASKKTSKDVKQANSQQNLMNNQQVSGQLSSMNNQQVGFPQHGDHCCQIRFPATPQKNLTAGRRAAAQISSRHDAICPNPVGTAVQLLSAADHHTVAPCAGNFAAAQPQKFLQLHNLRFPCGIENPRCSLRSAGCQHQIFRGTHRWDS